MDVVSHIFRISASCPPYIQSPPPLPFPNPPRRRKEIEDLRDYYECELSARDEQLAATRASAQVPHQPPDVQPSTNKNPLQLTPEDVAALTQETRALRAEAEERERLLSSTQQLLKIAQEQLFKGASSQGETRGQMCVIFKS